MLDLLTEASLCGSAPHVATAWPVLGMRVSVGTDDCLCACMLVPVRVSDHIRM